MDKKYYVYILTNKSHPVLYTGMTSDLKKRIYEHKEKLLPGFTRKYNVNNLVYYEAGNDALAVIDREKQIKDGSRQKKIRLVEEMNPAWRDLSEDL